MPTKGKTGMNRVRTYREALGEGIKEEMERDDRVFLLGEDVGVYGGAYKVSKGLLELFGKRRIIDAPLSEALIVGAGVGAALIGLRPISEIMYADFITIALDQLVHSGAYGRYMFGGNRKIPMVLRSGGGSGKCMAAQHSESIEAWVAANS